MPATLMIIIIIFFSSSMVIVIDIDEWTNIHPIWFWQQEMHNDAFWKCTIVK